MKTRRGQHGIKLVMREKFVLRQDFLDSWGRTQNSYVIHFVGDSRQNSAERSGHIGVKPRAEREIKFHRIEEQTFCRSVESCQLIEARTVGACLSDGILHELVGFGVTPPAPGRS